MKLIKLAKQLFTIPRSLAGKGNLETLNILSSKCKKKIKIKYFYSNSSLESYTRRPSQKPNYMFEKNTDTIKVDSQQLSDIYITNVQKTDNMTGPRTFESVIEKNILNMPPIIEREFSPEVKITFEKIGKNNELNFIENKITNREIEIPINPIISNKTILKRM